MVSEDKPQVQSLPEDETYSDMIVFGRMLHRFLESALKAYGGRPNDEAARSAAAWLSVAAEQHGEPLFARAFARIMQWETVRHRGESPPRAS